MNNALGQLRRLVGAAGRSDTVGTVLSSDPAAGLVRYTAGGRERIVTDPRPWPPGAQVLLDGSGRIIGAAPASAMTVWL